VAQDNVQQLALALLERIAVEQSHVKDILFYLASQSDQVPLLLLLLLLLPRRAVPPC
jgi:hypothetical protein